MITTEQKIDEIYEYILKKKKQEKIDLIIKWLIRILFIIYIIYIIFFMLPYYTEKYKGPLKKINNIINFSNLDKVDSK